MIDLMTNHNNQVYYYGAPPQTIGQQVFGGPVITADAPQSQTYMVLSIILIIFVILVIIFLIFGFAFAYNSSRF